MLANTEKISPSSKQASDLVADDISRHIHKSWDELFGMDRQEVEAFQLRAARRRFEELVPGVAALKDQADQNGVSRVEKLNDLVPLLFNHTAYKSYPISLLEKNRFDLLTQWLQHLTSIDLSNVNVALCESIDGWMAELEAQTSLQMFHTNGTTGKLSFLPRTIVERDTLFDVWLKAWGTGFGDESSTVLGGPNGIRLPVIYPSLRHGRYTAQRVVGHLAEAVAPSPDQCYTLSNGTLSADVSSLSGRIRIAQAKGQMSQLKMSDTQRIALKRHFEEQERRPQETAEFFDRVFQELQGKRVFIFSQSGFLYQASMAGLERNLSGVLAPDSVASHGGGGKGMVLPEGWFEQVKKFTGIPHWKMSYGMTEIISMFPYCPHDRFHAPPFTVPFLLDPESGAILPRQGTQTGRFAALDLLAQTYWGGTVSSDMITIEWDSACPCGRKGAFIHNNIERYSSNVTGDEKITCSATVDNSDAALQRLLAI